MVGMIIPPNEQTTRLWLEPVTFRTLALQGNTSAMPVLWSLILVWNIEASRWLNKHEHDLCQLPAIVDTVFKRFRGSFPFFLNKDFDNTLYTNILCLNEVKYKLKTLSHRSCLDYIVGCIICYFAFI